MFGIGLLFYTGWIIFGILLLFLGVRHPPPLNDSTPLDVKRYVVGACVAAVLVTGFVLTPLATPPGNMDLNNQPVSYLTPTGGQAIAANFTVQVVNQDPVPHGFVFTSSVSNVTVPSGNSTKSLTGAAFAAWVANSTWVYHLPDGRSYSVNGNNVSLPAADFLTVNATGSGSDSADLVITFSNTGAATGGGFQLIADEFCSSSTGGTDTTTWTAGWT